MIPQIKKILYATDLGKRMRPVFRYAISLARQYDARIEMLHVVEPLGPTGQAIVDLYLPKKVAAQLKDEGFHEVLQTMRKRLDAACREELGEDSARHPLISDLAVVSGSPAKSILQEARERKADLIVVGTHTDPSPGGALLGSTARKLTQISDIPVLVVPVQ